MVLEKSSDTSKTNLVENFEYNKNIKIIKNQFFWCSLCSVVSLQDMYSSGMYGLKIELHYTLYTITTLTTQMKNS